MHFLYSGLTYCYLHVPILFLQTASWIIESINFLQRFAMNENYVLIGRLHLDYDKLMTFIKACLCITK